MIDTYLINFQKDQNLYNCKSEITKNLSKLHYHKPMKRNSTYTTYSIKKSSPLASSICEIHSETSLSKLSIFKEIIEDNSFQQSTQSIAPFSPEFYEGLEKFLDDQNLYIVDPSCFHQSKKLPKKLMSLNKFHATLKSNTSSTLEILEANLSSAIALPETKEKLVLATNTVTNNFDSVKCSSLFQRRLEIHNNKQIEQKSNEIKSLTHLDTQYRELFKYSLVGSNSHSSVTKDYFDLNTNHINNNDVSFNEPNSPSNDPISPSNDQHSALTVEFVNKD